MMYIHSNNEIDKRINVSKIAHNISTMGDDSTAAWCSVSSEHVYIILVCAIVHAVHTRVRELHQVPTHDSYRPVGLTAVVA